MWKRVTAALSVLLLSGAAEASAFAGPRQDIVGVVVVQDNGCVDLDLGMQGRRWVIWPDTTQTENGGASIVLGGRVVADGNELRGSGMVADATQLHLWDEAYGLALEMFGHYCSSDKTGVVVLDDAVVSTR